MHKAVVGLTKKGTPSMATLMVLWTVHATLETTIPRVGLYFAHNAIGSHFGCRSRPLRLQATL